IVEELLAMGHDWDNIAIQEFTYWQVHDMGLQTFGSLNWDNVTSPWILGVDRDYQIRADRVSQNVVLTLPGQSERMIIVGAHYDSPPYPSASDNASGTALLMESAQRMLELEHYYTIVYVFFGAEEVGLVGAYYYLESLTARERDNILMMVNADVIIEGPYIIYGAGSVPVLDDAKLASLVEAIMADEGILDFLLMQYQMIRAELTEMGIEDMGSQFPFDSFESLVEFQAAIFAASPTDLLMQAYMLGLVEPYIDDVAQQVTDIAAQLTSQHDFELISIPDVIGFSSDQLAFLFGGHTVVNFVGLERLDNIDAELAAQLFAVMDIFDGFSATVLHTVLDNFQFIEATWPGMINANLEAFMILLEAILTGSFS
ncbi:MAG: M28 family peptidase, partial [Defluviitaleaceae bacterium]|nr:M28 family peptidase [Defluviitaleaceae bacterium]